MKNIQDFIQTLRRLGLEYFGLYYGIYRGTVSDNKDPENLGRIRIKVPQIYGKESPEKWVEQKGNGIFYVPEIGEPIFVTFEGGNTRFPIYECGWYAKTPGDAKSVNQKNIVIQRDGRTILIDSDNKKIVIKDASGLTIDMDAKGIFIGNDVENLLSILQDLTTQLSIANVSGVPLSNAPAFVELSARLSLFLK